MIEETARHAGHLDIPRGTSQWRDPGLGRAEPLALSVPGQGLPCVRGDFLLRSG